MPASRALREERRQVGLCLPCGDQAVEGETRCERCKKLHQDSSRRMIARKAAAGVCLDCPEQALPNHRRCAKHRRISTEASRKSFRKRGPKSPGLCYHCGDPALDAVTHRRFPICEVCYLKSRARYHLGSFERWKDLRQKLEEQDFRCPYTGEKIELGRNDSIDHKLPTSKYPDLWRDISNIEWVTRAVNTAKGNMTKEEFLAWIALVHSFAGHGASLKKLS